MNMAGGQPFSVENLAEVHRLAREHEVPLILDATRISENAVFVKDREPGWRELAAARRSSARSPISATARSSPRRRITSSRSAASSRSTTTASPSVRASSWSSTRASPTTAGSRDTTWRRSRRGSASRPTRPRSGTTSLRRRISAACSRRREYRSSFRSGHTACSWTQSAFSPTFPRSSSPPRHSRRRSIWPAASARWSAASSPASTATSPTTGSSSCGSRSRAACTRRSTWPMWQR